MKQAGMVQAILAHQKRTFPGKDPISNTPTYRNFPTNTSVQVKGEKGDPQVKGVKAKYHNQKQIGVKAKNVKLGGMRNNKLVHDKK